MVEGDGGETDNGMKPASMPCTPCGSREAGSARKFDIFTDGFDIPPPPLRQMNDWQHFERGANWLAWNQRTGETCGGATPWWGIGNMTEENKVAEGLRFFFEVSPERNEDGSRQRWCMASGDSPYASSGCPWSINTGDEMGSNEVRSSSSTEGEGDHQGTTESPSGGNAVVRGETGAQGVTPTTIAELRDNGMHSLLRKFFTTSGADPHTTEFPSGGNAVVRGEAGAPMTMAELRDGATHDVEAEEEKKKIAAAHQKIADAQEMTQVRQATVEPGPTTVKDVRAGETNADSAKRPSAEVGCGRLHQTLAAATMKKIPGNANHGAQVTQDSLTTVEPGLTTVKEVRAGETNADSATVNERPSAEVGCGRLHQTFAAYTAAPKRRGCKATLQLATTPKQELKKAKKPAQVDTPWGMRLTCDEQAMAYDSAYEEVLEMRENADKQMRAWMEDMGHAEKIMNDHDSRMYAHQRAEEAVKAAMREKKATAEANDPRMTQLKMCENGDSDETKRVRSDKGTRAVQELHGQHPSLND